MSHKKKTEPQGLAQKVKNGKIQCCTIKIKLTFVMNYNSLYNGSIPKIIFQYPTNSTRYNLMPFEKSQYVQVRI